MVSPSQPRTAASELSQPEAATKVADPTLVVDADLEQWSQPEAAAKVADLREAADQFDAAKEHIAAAALALSRRDLRSAIGEGRRVFTLYIGHEQPIDAELQFARRYLQDALDELDRAMCLAGVDPRPGVSNSSGGAR